MRNTIYYDWFIRSLNKSHKHEYDQCSINQQKDWYILYLENRLDSRKEGEKS